MIIGNITPSRTHDGTYLDCIKDVFRNGCNKGDRTGTGTTSLFGEQYRYPIQLGFPLFHIKHVSFKNIAAELLWFISRSTNINDLKKTIDCKIWDEWADETGSIGPLYGEQWRSWGFTKGGETVDQLGETIERLRTNPDSRRHVISSWDPSLLPDESISPIENVKNGKQALAPCHPLFQFYIRHLEEDDHRGILNMAVHNGMMPYGIYTDGMVYLELSKHIGEEAAHKLDPAEARKKLCEVAKLPTKVLECKLYQRSVDCGLGMPYNVASYALLTAIIAKMIGVFAGDFIHSLGDAHIYNNHREGIDMMLARTPMTGRCPVLRISDRVATLTRIEDVTMDDISIHGYHPYDAIPLPVAV